MKDDDKNKDRKQERRQKIDKNRKKDHYSYNDDDIDVRKLKKQFKKTREQLDEEEWKNWDKYYNH